MSEGFVGAHAEDVSPDDIANVLGLVEHRTLPAVLSEPPFSVDAPEQVARDAGIQVDIVQSLQGTEHTDYIGMVRANADQMTQFLP